MNRLKMRCLCCGTDVELIRDHISGPDHYRCGNCFEIVDLDQLEHIEKVNKELDKLEEARHALLAKN